MMGAVMVTPETAHLVVEAFCDAYDGRFTGRTKALSDHESAELMEWIMKTMVAYGKLNGYAVDGLHEGLDLLWSEADDIIKPVAPN
jgi:hypothetical protein